MNEAHSQTIPDSTLPSSDILFDEDLDYDALFNELGSFLDSLLAPRNYFTITAGLTQGYFNYFDKSSHRLAVKKSLVMSPTITYVSKHGPGISLGGSMVEDKDRLQFYQYSITPSFDFLQNREYAAGLSFTRYFTKDSLSFYTSPLQNEIGAYFLWRKSWIQPGLSASYAWGSEKEYKERLKFIQWLRARRLRLENPDPFLTVREKSITDFSVTASIRHSFYWLSVFSKRDNIKLNPVIAFTAGSQKFGFNQSHTTRLANYYLRNINLEKETKFQPLALTLYLRTEYSIGKFFLQPQLMVDYYFPATGNGFSCLAAINAGIFL